MESRIEERRKAFKKGVDPLEARRKREDLNVALRKQNKDEQLMKRRQIANTAESEQIVAAPTIANDTLGKLIMGINSDDVVQQQTCTKDVRKMLSVEKDPPIQQVIDTGVVPRLVAFLSAVDRPDLQFEAAWALTNIASGSADQTAVVIQSGAIPLFIQLLSSPVNDVQEQAVWALGNISGDSTQCRDQVLQAGIMQPLLFLLRSASSNSLLKNATWALSNLCRGKPQAPFQVLTPALDTLACLLNHTDLEVLTDTCWAFSYLSDGPSENIDAVIGCGVASRLVDLLRHTSPLVQTPALRTVGNIVTGDDKQTQVMIDCGVIASLVPLLSSPKKAIKKEACWTLSNITAGSQQQVQNVLDAGIAPVLVHLASAAEFEIKKEASWALSNAVSGGNPKQIMQLCDAGVIKVMCDLLSVQDVRLIRLALETLDIILKLGARMAAERQLGVNPVVERMEECEGINKLELLQEDKNEEIYKMASDMLSKYFDLEEEEGDLGESNMPAGNGQAFGTNMQAPAGGFNFA